MPQEETADETNLSPTSQREAPFYLAYSLGSTLPFCLQKGFLKTDFAAKKKKRLKTTDLNTNLSSYFKFLKFNYKHNYKKLHVYIIIASTYIGSTLCQALFQVFYIFKLNPYNNTMS